MSTVVKDLGAVSAYAYAVEKGYTGTEAEFAELMADYAEVGQRAEDAADSALESKTAAQTAATTATNKASEATTAAQTATTKAGEASQSASQAQASAQTASTKASEASASATTASAKATEATTAAGTATTAKDDAVTAKNAAQTAQTAAETAQGAAEDAAESVSASAAQIAQNTSDISDVKEELSAIEDVEYHVSPNLLNFNDPDFLTGKYIYLGTIYNSGSYNTSGYIQVEENKTYTFTYGSVIGYPMQMRFITAYDSSKSVVTSACQESKTTYTVPQGVAYVRLSCDSTYFRPEQSNVMFYEGTTIDQYYEYYPPYYTYEIKNEALDADYLNGLINAKIVNTVTDYGLSVSATVDSMSSADTLTVVQNIDNKKNAVIEFWGAFSSFTSLTIGHGDHINYGNYAVIDNTNITDYYGSGSQQMAQQAHGLTLSDFIHVVITQNNGARAKIQIITATGDYTLSDCSWDGCRGDIFVKVGATMTDCVCNSIFKDFNEKVFVFGDSYVGLEPARYPYYLIQNGYTHFYLDGWGGRNSIQALTSFNNVIANAVPKYAVWALGMNDADTSSAINTSWLSCVQSFISICEENGITPILATIPNCPDQLNTFKNSWVKSSGNRYVDFAKAVGAEEAASTWYEGMLSTDNVHPTALGAKALFARFIIDMPEVIR